MPSADFGPGCAARPSRLKTARGVSRIDAEVPSRELVERRAGVAQAWLHLACVIIRASWG